MIYSFHHYNYWLKGGVETGLAHRARLFRNLGLDAKFVFATTFPEHNIWEETRRLGFLDSEVLWMYGFFTDCKPSAVTYTLEQLESTFEERDYIFSRDGMTAKYQFPQLNVYYVVFMTDETNNFVHRVMMVSNGCLVRKDYYTYCRVYSEYYIPVNGRAFLYQRKFFHEDGSIAYEELTEGGSLLYKFPDRLLYSREELAGYMMSCLRFTTDDVVLIDGEWGIIDLSAFIQNAFPARIGFIVHLNHFRYSDEDFILWNEAYESVLVHSERVSFFVTNTEVQSELLKNQLRHYKGIDSRVETIPVAYLSKVRRPEKARKKYSLITAGRLEADKRTGWLIEATVMARKEIPELTLDIYGEGEEEGKLREQIDKAACGEYVHLCGFQKLDDIYQDYEAYVSASYGETFGITLLEAVGSGLPIVGFDRPYGIQAFVDDGKNGFRISQVSIEGLAKGIVRLFREADLDMLRKHSYAKAKYYLETEVQKKWKEILHES
ncbi:MAG: glycosyltransferase [Ruminococcus flavefaciens]|nr:glycosyltransferase [Ruminococcus flavefaciens]